MKKADTISVGFWCSIEKHLKGYFLFFAFLVSNHVCNGHLRFLTPTKIFRPESLTSSNIYVLSVRGGQQGDVIGKDRHDFTRHLSEQSEHTTHYHPHNDDLQRRRSISVEEMELRLKELQSRRPAYLKVPPPPPPPPPVPPPPIQQIKLMNNASNPQQDASLNNERKDHPNDIIFQKKKQNSIRGESVINSTFTNSNYNAAKIQVNSTFSTQESKHYDHMNPLLNGDSIFSNNSTTQNRYTEHYEEPTSQPLQAQEAEVSSIGANDNRAFKGWSVFSKLGKKAYSLVASNIPFSSGSYDNLKTVFDASSDDEVNCSDGYYQMMEFDSNTRVSIFNPSPTPWKSEDCLLYDVLNTFSLYFKLLSIIYPNRTRQKENTSTEEEIDDEEAIFGEPSLDIFDVSEVDEDSEPDTTISSLTSRGEINNSIELAIKSSLIQSIVPMLQEYTAEYMMQMPTRMKRTTRVISKSIRVRETVLSQLDVSDTNLDITNTDFERLLFELSSGPAEEIIEEIEYEYDEWPLHFDMLDDMEEHILEIIEDEKHLIELKTDDNFGTSGTPYTEDFDVHNIGNDFDGADYDDDLLDDSDLCILEEAEPSDFGWISEDESD